MKVQADAAQNGQQPGQSPVTAFPNSPKAPPPRVKDLNVPPAPAPAGSTQAGGRDFSAPISSDEAAKIALRLQPSLGTQVGVIQFQQGKTRQIGSVGNPQLILGTGYDDISSIAGATPGSIQAPNLVSPLGASPVFPITASAEVRQLLFDFNQTRNLVRQSEALERSAQQQLTTAQLNLVFGVKQAFFNFSNAMRVIGVDEANVANRQRQLDLASARLNIGLGQPSDLVTAQTSKSQGILILNEARDSAEQARIQLLQQMGIDPQTPVRPIDETAAASADQDAKSLVDMAIRHRPEVKAAIESLAAAKYGLDAAKSLDYPSIYAEIGAGVAGSNFPLKDNTVNFGIGLQFPLFDGGNRAGAVRAAKGVIKEAQSSFDTTILQVKSDVASAYMGLRSALQRVDIANNEVFNAQEAVRVAEGRYSAGVGLFLDVTTAQNLLLTAQTDQASARNTLDQARVQLRRATGEMVGDFK